MKKSFTSTLFFGSLLSALMLSSQALAGLSEEYYQCMEHSGADSLKMLDCIAKEASVQETLLNQQLKFLVAQSNDVEHARLMKSQVVWLEYREAQSSLVDSGDLIGKVNKQAKALDITAERVDEFTQMIGHQGNSFDIDDCFKISLFLGVYDYQGKGMEGEANFIKKEDGSLYLDIDNKEKKGGSCSFDGKCSYVNSVFTCVSKANKKDKLEFKLTAQGLFVPQPYPKYCSGKAHLDGTYIKRSSKIQ